MFTNNYINYRKGFFDWSYQSFKFHDGSTATKYFSPNYAQGAQYWIDMGAIIQRAFCQALSDYSQSYAHNRAYAGVYFGTGSTPATKGDYNLSGLITSGLTITNPSSTTWVSSGEGSYTISADYIVRNTTGNDISICEIGAFGQISYDSSNVRPVLFERTVLETPIVIPSGEAKLVTYKIEFNQTV